jgi:hypothetical protein
MVVELEPVVKHTDSVQPTRVNQHPPAHTTHSLKMDGISTEKHFFSVDCIRVVYSYPYIATHVSMYHMPISSALSIADIEPWVVVEEYGLWE